MAKRWIISALCLTVISCRVHSFRGLVVENGSEAIPLKNIQQVYKAAVGVGVVNSGVLREQVPPEPINGIYLHDATKLVGSHLRRLSNEELGFAAMQAIYDSLPFTLLVRNDEKRVQELASRLQMKLKKYLAVLNKSRAAVEELFFHHLQKPIAAILPCRQIPSSSLSFSNHFGTKISKEHTCDIIPPLMDPFAFRPGQNLTKVFAENLRSHPTIKWQYFISTEGVHSEFPAHLSSEDSRHRDIFLSTVQPTSKHVVVIVDQGNSLSPHQLAVCKAVASHVIQSLSSHDKVGVVGLAGEVMFAGSDQCLSQRMTFATQQTKAHLERFLQGLVKAKVGTNHSLGLQAAFEMIRNTLPNKNDSPEALIVYVSRGLLSSLTEAKVVMETVAREANRTQVSVVINTYAAIDDGKPVMYEKHFLQDLAQQSFAKYNVSAPIGGSRPGLAMAVNSTRNLVFSVGRFYSVLNTSGRREPTFSLPHWDAVGKGVVVSLAQPCFHVDHILGMVGMDLYLADVVEDFTYYNQYGHTRAFLIDKSGVVLSHPTLTRPTFSSQPPAHTDISHLESTPGFSSVREAMLSTLSGKHTLNVTDSSNATSSPNQMAVEYTWQLLEGAGYVACIATESGGPEVWGMKRVGVGVGGVVYHRLDIGGSGKARMCRHFQQMSTTDAAALFLSVACFSTPFEFFNQKDVTLSNVQSYMAYLADNTKLIANPGLKPGIRSEVRALSRVVSEWKKQFAESALYKYIVRRYVTTPSGVMLLHPASRVSSSTDPTRLSWYLRALAHPGKVVLSAPHLDPGGAGYVVTLSHTVYEGKSVSLHSATDGVVAVVAMDMTLGYLYRVLKEVMGFCGEESVRCFLMEDRGYLVAHPSLNQAEVGRIPTPVEQQHVTHREPLVANDILNHEGFIHKSLCNSFPDRTVQRFYRFNTSFRGGVGERGVLTNLVHGEHCSRYQVSPVPGTNLFLGIVNDTCESVTTFCPCSMVDRLCLNCHRMEQSECECPCECPLELDLCTGDLMDTENENPSCSYFPEQPRLLPTDDSAESDMVLMLPPCFIINCDALQTESECFGVMGCEWCTVDVGGESALPNPFCAAQRKCFGGVLGAMSPYRAIVTDPLPSEEYLSFKSTPVGPVAGGTMVFFLALALLVYCYRHHVHQRSSSSASSSSSYEGGRGYLAALPVGGASGVRMSQLRNEGEEGTGGAEQEDLAPGGCHNFLEEEEEDFDDRNDLSDQASLAVAVSPYRVNTAYRRPAGGDSDHGYSTMTPHEDSEHLPYFQPLLVGSPRSSPRSSPREGEEEAVWGGRRGAGEVISQTLLPEDQHHVLAPVTVHMMDVS